MFIYICNIQNQKEAEAAIAHGATGIGVELGYKKSALAAEETRGWLEELPLPIFKIGQFSQEAYYDVEEMAAFCHLDCINLAWQDDLTQYSRYSGRILIHLPQGETVLSEEKIRQITETAKGLVLHIDAKKEKALEQIERWRSLAKPIFLTGAGKAVLSVSRELTKEGKSFPVQQVYGWYLPLAEWQAADFVCRVP